MNTQSKSFIRAVVAEYIVTHLERMNIDTTSILGSLKLERKSLQDPYAFVAFSDYTELLNYASKVSDNQSIGLQLGNEQNPTTLGPMGLALLNAPTVKDFLLCTERYVRSFQGGSHVQVQYVGEYLQIEYKVIDPFVLHCDHDVELSVAFYVKILKIISGKKDLISDITFSHGPLADKSEYEFYLGRQPLFNADKNAIYIAKENADTVNIKADLNLYNVMKHHLDDLLAEVKIPRDRIEEVRMCIQTSLGGPTPTLQSVSQHMNIHSRALQRTLKENGTSYSELLQTVRKEQAIGYLRRSVPIKTIAHNLSYSNENAFYKAFKKWTGMTPNEFIEDLS